MQLAIQPCELNARSAPKPANGQLHTFSRQRWRLARFGLLERWIVYLPTVLGRLMINSKGSSRFALRRSKFLCVARDASPRPTFFVGRSMGTFHFIGRLIPPSLVRTYELRVSSDQELYLLLL